MTHPTPTILILAGQRLGKIDPLSAKYEREHKCLVPMLGRPLIGYVFDAVNAAFPDARIIVSINDPTALEAEPEAQPFIEAGRMTIVPSAKNLLESVLAAAGGASYPLLMTTGDNVLVTAEAYRNFYASALEQEADVAAMMAHKEDVLAEHPTGQSRFWKFADGEYSNCNTFFARDADALSVGEIFRGGGQFLKFPKRFVGAFGVLNLIGYRLGVLKTKTMLDRVSRRFGKKIRLQITDRGRFAVDVDDQNTYDVTEKLLLEDGVKPRAG
ncbi:nucleotidyltransferase family protein [Alteraurantiacibacter aquimixticola]|uniref:MobA-like NTP transferase domain-containing protein n=1 Tax=Alteraurantiacibacter aquimixticola TaxID=2489173 RepID=A0A4T3F0G2_9SPHN|nr:nucleotidyltransferase family protein [Alteraurantiacibacter aquimixticola]TIX50519.1 hypothetical protein E5222_09630 [Alteraurantiacibacter aquimixticola]